MNPARLSLLLVAIMLLPGCAWYKGWANAPQAPTVFSNKPTLEQITQHLNSSTVTSLEAERAKISLDGLPSLNARLVMERPRNLRFRVETSLTGPEMDMGSNAEIFWLWAKRNDPPAVFYARHDQFAGSAARQMIPIQPEWIGEALGVIYLDPQGRHEGPIDRGNHRLEVRSKLMTADGEMTRVLVINDTYGWILEQHLYDQRGQLVASAKASQHRHYPVEGVSLPHHIDISLPTAQLGFALDVAQYRIKSLTGSPEQLFTMPQFVGYPVVDVADPNFRPPGAPIATGNVGHSADSRADSRAGYRPQVRGLR